MSNHIVQYIHCKKCLEELPENTSPQMYAHLEMGWTRAGFEVRCVRHDVSVMHIDLLGQKVAYYKEKTKDILPS